MFCLKINYVLSGIYNVVSFNRFVINYKLRRVSSLVIFLWNETTINVTTVELLNGNLSAVHSHERETSFFFNSFIYYTIIDYGF